ncbi:MAG: hypothetical protein HRT68_15645 [Flavobacteriaceae bacterium]|nr:hypothetical protein [Flavobacteriaceae bacterium]
MSTPKEINIALFKPLKSGRKYDKYFSYSDCTYQYLGHGYTDFSIKSMINYINKFNDHTEKIALNEFTGKPLQETCFDIHSFLYHHIQYKIDEGNQLLRSPNCAWSSRTIGIDCKSYSIFASSILLNLGINHFIRKIKQPNSNPIFEDHFTHVYVIVPKNQKLRQLKSGDQYYTIDATIPSVSEPFY